MSLPTLRDLRDQILITGPEQFEMSVFVENGSKGACVAEDLEDFDFADCGTVGCVCGHGAVMLSKAGFIFHPGHWIDQTEEHFGLPSGLVDLFWERVPFGDSTLEVCRQEYEATGMTFGQSQYHAALDWLDAEIKARNL